jgi:chromosome segregation ATPase
MDQSKYINTYIDVIIGQLHETLSNNLQLKTQVKIANDIIQEKDQAITNLQNQLSSVQNNDEDVRKAKEQAKHWEDSYHAMSVKVVHMDTVLKQISDMKNQILLRDKQIEELQTKLTKPTKKVINKKEVIQETITDDF